MANMWRAFMSETTLLSELLSIEVFLSSAHNHDDDDTGHKDDTCGMWICCYSMFSLCLRSSIKVNGYSKGGCKSGKGGQVGLKDSCERFHGKSIPSSATADFSPDPASQNFCRSCKFAPIWQSFQSRSRPLHQQSDLHLPTLHLHAFHPPIYPFNQCPLTTQFHVFYGLRLRRDKI